MIISRAPLRISLGGGGTDLPSFYSEHGGFFVSAAIDKYIFVSANRTFDDQYVLKYSDSERVNRVTDIRHPIFREALSYLKIDPAIELSSIADIPAGTGLGSSGTFTVALLKALHAHNRTPIDSHQLAEEACHIEMDRLAEPCGKQDQFIASFGGLTCFEIDTNGTVTISPLQVSTETLQDLETHLLLFFTGYARKAAAMLSDQKARSESGDADMILNLKKTKALGLHIRDALEAGDCLGFAEMMHQHWVNKRARSSGMSNSEIDDCYELAVANGAEGGKLVGAGAGGFLMLYASDPRRVRAALAGTPVRELPFRFDHDGAIVLARS